MSKVTGIIGIVIGGWIAHNYIATNSVVLANYGISFGIRMGATNYLYILLLVIIGVTFIVHKNMGLGLIEAGGIINLIDRIMLGYVRDYWHIFSLYNNLADWLILVGLGGILLSTIRHERGHRL